MTQIHQDLSNNGLQEQASISENVSSNENRSVESNKNVVFSFYDQWTKTKTKFKGGQLKRAGESKPKSLWKAESTLINVATSLSVAKANKLQAKSGAVAEVIQIDQSLIDAIDEARTHVGKDIMPYMLEAQKQELKEILIKIETSQLKFESEKQRMDILHNTKETIRQLAQDMRGMKPQYTKALKSLKNFAATVVRLNKEIRDPNAREVILADSVEFIEDMMAPVETSWKGIPGKSNDLDKIKPEEMSDLGRLEQIRQHLALKIDAIDAKQFRRLEKIASHPLIEEILNKFKAGELPRNGSIFFFVDSGRPLLRIDACANPKTRPGQSKESALRHAIKTPEFVDINRLDKGIGPDGAGLFRFAELTDRICGAIILAPVMQDGKEVRLPGMSKPKRQVKELIGDVPDCIETNMSYGAVLNKFRTKIEKLLADRNLL